MYVTVCVVDGTRKVLPWTMWLCSEEHTFVKLFEEVRTRLPDDSERLPTACTLAKATDGLQQVAVELSFNVVQCCALNGSYIRFALQPEENRSTSSQAQANAFSVMMTCTRKLKLPPKLLPAEKYEAGKGDQRLHDDVIDFLDMKKLGFRPQQVNFLFLILGSGFKATRAGGQITNTGNNYTAFVFT